LEITGTIASRDNTGIFEIGSEKQFDFLLLQFLYILLRILLCLFISITTATKNAQRAQ
jgi:hypothetical protein